MRWLPSIPVENWEIFIPLFPALLWLILTILFNCRITTNPLFPNPIALITSLPELLLSKCHSSNFPFIPNEQYVSDINRHTDWDPSASCHPDHLHHCTTQQHSSISCSTLQILLAITDANGRLLHIEVTMADIIHHLYPSTSTDRCLHCINTPLLLGQYSRVGSDDVVEGHVSDGHWCGDSAVIWLMNLIPLPPDIIIEWYLVSRELWLLQRCNTITGTTMICNCLFLLPHILPLRFPSIVLPHPILAVILQPLHCQLFPCSIAVG